MINNIKIPGHSGSEILIDYDKQNNAFVKKISSSLNKSKSKSYIFNYPNDNGKSEVTDFIYSNGSIRVWCSDYSKKGEKIFYDFLGVLVSTKEHDDWIKNEAY